MAKISIIMPVYNGERFLEKSLDSALSQDLIDIELVCVDDGSTDKSLDILKKYKQKDKRVVILMQTNQGSGAARNLAISHAKGEFITFLDSDDWYPSNNVLSTLYDKARKYKQKMAGGSFVRYYENGKIESEFHGVYKAYKFEKEEIILSCDYQFDYGYHRFIYDRTMLSQHNIIFPDYRRFQDPPFFLRALLASGSFIAINKQVYAYRKGHQVVNWDLPKLVGLLSGLLENLIISKKYNMDKLHKIMIDRLENDFFKEVEKNVGTATIRYLLARFVQNIDSNLLKKEYKDFNLNSLKIYKLLNK